MRCGGNTLPHHKRNHHVMIYLTATLTVNCTHAESYYIESFPAKKKKGDFIL